VISPSSARNASARNSEWRPLRNAAIVAASVAATLPGNARAQATTAVLGRCVTSLGSPVAAARVTGRSGQSIATTRSDTAGRWTLALKTDRISGTVVACEHPWYGEGRRTLRGDEARVSVEVLRRSDQSIAELARVTVRGRAAPIARRAVRGTPGVGEPQELALGASFLLPHRSGELDATLRFVNGFAGGSEEAGVLSLNGASTSLGSLPRGLPLSIRPAFAAFDPLVSGSSASRVSASVAEQQGPARTAVNFDHATAYERGPIGLVGSRDGRIGVAHFRSLRDSTWSLQAFAQAGSSIATLGQESALAFSAPATNDLTRLRAALGGQPTSIATVIDYSGLAVLRRVSSGTTQSVLTLQGSSRSSPVLGVAPAEPSARTGSGVTGVSLSHSQTIGNAGALLSETTIALENSETWRRGILSPGAQILASDGTVLAAAGGGLGNATQGRVFGELQQELTWAVPRSLTRVGAAVTLRSTRTEDDGNARAAKSIRYASVDSLLRGEVLDAASRVSPRSVSMVSRQIGLGLSITGAMGPRVSYIAGVRSDLDWLPANGAIRRGTSRHLSIDPRFGITRRFGSNEAQGVRVDTSGRREIRGRSTLVRFGLGRFQGSWTVDPAAQAALSQFSQGAGVETQCVTTGFVPFQLIRESPAEADALIQCGAEPDGSRFTDASRLIPPSSWRSRLGVALQRRRLYSGLDAFFVRSARQLQTAPWSAVLRPVTFLDGDGGRAMFIDISDVDPLTGLSRVAPRQVLDGSPIVQGLVSQRWSFSGYVGRPWNGPGPIQTTFLSFSGRSARTLPQSASPGLPSADALTRATIGAAGRPVSSFSATLAHSLDTRVAFIGAEVSLVSGSPISATVSTDLDGDGLRNDLPVLDSVIGAQLREAPAGLRACLLKDRGRFMRPGRCRGPLQVSSLLFIRLQSFRFGPSGSSMTLSLSDPLALILPNAARAPVAGGGARVIGFDRSRERYRVLLDESIVAAGRQRFVVPSGPSLVMSFTTSIGQAWDRYTVSQGRAEVLKLRSDSASRRVLLLDRYRRVNVPSLFRVQGDPEINGFRVSNLEREQLDALRDSVVRLHDTL
jgi:hypothetical protein